MLLAISVSSQAATLPPPQSVARGADQVRDRCVRQEKCDVNACVSNGGLKSCYHRALLFLDQRLVRLEAELAKRDPWCADHWGVLKEKHRKFQEQALVTANFADAPYSTDDDLRLLLAQQEYALAYQVLSNTACRQAVAPAPRR